jgi:ribosomal silencing factor RsfS
MEYNSVRVANFLIDEKGFDVGPLVARQLDDFADVFVFLDGPVTRKILLERLADAFHVQVLGQAGHGGNTFAPVALLDPHVDLVTRVAGGRSRVLKGVWVEATTKQTMAVSQTVKERRTAASDEPYRTR